MSQPTDGELAILRVLWTCGPATVRKVNEVLNDDSEREIGYTTTLKLMQLMAEKRLVSRDTSSRSHVYTALLPEKKTRENLLTRFVDSAFGGSRGKLVLQALGNGETSADELAEIKRLIEKLEKEEGNA